MKYGKIASIVGIMVLATQAAWAAGGESTGRNGGLGAVCRDDAGKITKVVLLDLVEADFDGLTPIEPLPTTMDYLNLVNKRLGFKVAQNRFTETLPKVWQSIVVKNRKFELPNPGDYHARAGLRGCPLEVIGLYQDSLDGTPDHLNVDAELFEFLKKDSLQLNAFLVHEAIYKIARQWRATNSDIVRKIVGQVLAQNTDEQKLWALVSSPKTFGTRIACQFIEGSKYQVFGLRGEDGEMPTLDNDPKFPGHVTWRNDTWQFDGIQVQAECSGSIDWYPLCRMGVGSSRDFLPSTERYATLAPGNDGDEVTGVVDGRRVSVNCYFQ